MPEIYFDNAATTKLDQSVKDVMINAMEVYGNASSVHSLGRKSKVIIETTRANISKYINCHPSEITFTSGGTESDNLAISGVVEANDIKTIISSKLEHPAVIETILKSEKRYETKVLWVNHLDTGMVDLAHLQELLSVSSNALVSLMHINNEIGTVLDIEKVGKLCKDSGAIFHSDTVQSIGHIPIDLTKLPVDLLTCSAHKLHGPKGIGFLYHRKGIKITSQLVGGKQERESRGGTENIIGIAGLGEALSVSFSDFTEINGTISRLKAYFIKKMKGEFGNIRFNGLCDDSSQSINTIVNVNFPNLSSNEMLLFQLDLKGIMVSGGSACSSGSLTGSKVLNELGVEGASVRFSFSKNNTESEIDSVIKILKEIID